jgi:hypothetical protein
VTRSVQYDRQSCSTVSTTVRGMTHPYGLAIRAVSPNLSYGFNSTLKYPFVVLEGLPYTDLFFIHSEQHTDRHIMSLDKEMFNKQLLAFRIGYL